MNTKNNFRLVLIFGWMVFATAGFAQSSAKQINEATKNIKAYQNKNPSQCKTDLLGKKVGVEDFQPLRSKGSMCSMSSKGCGMSSADVGVFTNHQSPKKLFKSIRWFNSLMV